MQRTGAGLCRLSEPAGRLAEDDLWFRSQGLPYSSRLGVPSSCINYLTLAAVLVAITLMTYCNGLFSLFGNFLRKAYYSD